MQRLQSWLRRDLSDTGLDALSSDTKSAAVAISLSATVTRLDSKTRSSVLHGASCSEVLLLALVGQDRHAEGGRLLVGRSNRRESIHAGNNAEKSDNKGHKGLHGFKCSVSSNGKIIMNPECGY